MPLWKTLGKATWMFRRHTLPKTVAVTALIVGAIAASLLYQKDFTLEGDGKLRPRVQANVFAQIDGTVQSIAVTDDQRVAQGEELVTLQNYDLGKDLANTRGRLDEIGSQYSTLDFEITTQQGELSPKERAQKLAQRARLKVELISLRAELELLETKRQLLTVTSPIKGQIITSRVEERLNGRPVRRGQVLLEVADPERDWILEVKMPEKRLGHITRAIRESDKKELEVEFLLATNTEATLTGTLREADIAASSEVRGDEGNTVLLTVEFDQAEFRAAAPDPKVGAEVKARVHCGRASLAYAYLHDLVDFVRSKILFRL